MFLIQSQRSRVALSLSLDLLPVSPHVSCQGLLGAEDVAAVVAFMFLCRRLVLFTLISARAIRHLIVWKHSSDMVSLVDQKRFLAR